MPPPFWHATAGGPCIRGAPLPFGHSCPEVGNQAHHSTASVRRGARVPSPRPPPSALPFTRERAHRSDRPSGGPSANRRRRCRFLVRGGCRRPPPPPPQPLGDHDHAQPAPVARRGALVAGAATLFCSTRRRRRPCRWGEKRYVPGGSRRRCPRRQTGGISAGWGLGRGGLAAAAGIVGVGGRGWD